MIKICKHVKNFEELVKIFNNEEFQIENCVDKCEICCGTKELFVIIDDKTIVAGALDELKSLIKKD
ncbi:MAG: hypothetical protein H0Z24_04295 [Thermosipho sp. (in: Bacteria)]|nr:hypothetical protein [Thermosipho sp. (in: thermotogales)]